MLPIGRPGAQSPRPAPAGSGAGLLLVPDLPVCRAPSRAGGGTAGRVSWSRPAMAKALSTPQWQGPPPLPQRYIGIRTSRRPKAPGQRPPRPRRALRTRRVGRWPFVCPGPAGLRGTVARGRGKRGSRFLIPPGNGKSTVNASRAGATAPATALHWYQDKPGAQSPRPAPAPPLAGASRPPGRALASDAPGPAGLQGTVAQGRGKRGSRFLIPPGTAKALSPLPWQGPSPLPQRRAGIRTSRGPKPPASARPALGGRFAPAGSGAGL